MNRLNSKLTRRALLRGTAIGAAGLGAMAIAGCGDDGDTKPAAMSALATVTAAPPTPTAAAPTVLTWTRVPLQSGPGARRDHSLTLNPDNGLIYLFGGRAQGIADNELWTFEPGTAVWRQVAATGAPGARFAHNAFYDRAGKRLIVTLGEGNDGAFFDDVCAYEAGAWTRLDADSVARPEIRYGSGGAHDVAGNRILISHGFTDRGGRFDDTWTFDLAGGAWQQVTTTGAVPIKRCLTRCLWLPGSGSMLMFGGQTDSNPFLGDLWTLDVVKGAWVEQTPSSLPGPRNLYGASLDGDGKRWYIVGGNTAAGPSGETWSYDVATSAWSLVAAAGDQPPARYSTDAAHAGGALYIFGGHDRKSEIDDMWMLAAS